ncbi:histidine kinase N-terminal 7TM domain-containing protein [Cyclobacterium sp. SYSU L10401]|uniref:histidine kinase N-terminal 7TM domain-containing protein n=1 Tax=Cyclobacterium sp. SYSU L10401 TaxID=2678657 RepID=UPI001969E6BA|nr:histidine kinase N-terminal 7TM domain-containing protein [Cyclobacterium sp. SYSU L10401]
MLSFSGYPFLLILMVAVAIVPLLFPLFVRKRDQESVYTYFIWIMVACFTYSFTYVLELALTTVSLKILMIKAQYLGAVFFAPLVILFTLAYTERNRWITRRLMYALFFLPLLNLLGVWTNEWHHLFYTSFSTTGNGLFQVMHTGKGIGYWLHQGYTLILLFVSLWFLVKRVREIPPADSRQVIMVILGLCSPLLLYVLYLADMIPSLLDPMPFGFLGTGLFFYLGLKKFNLFKMVPIAYRTLFDNMQEGVLVLDTKGDLVTLNLSAASLIGVSSVQEKIAVQEIKKCWPEIHQLFSDRNSYQIHELKRQVDGFSHWYLITKSLVRDENQRIAGSLLVIRDITQQKNFQIEIERSRELAEEANQAKSEFLANMSHEIRTPLNGVIGFTELLTKTNLNEQQLRYAQTALNSANVLLGLINDVLDLAKIESGKAELHPENISLHTLLENILDVLSFLAHQKGLELILDLDANVPGNIETDELKLRQVLINLLNNALKFTESGEVILKVEWEAIAGNSNKGQVRFSVIDSGIGIAKEKQELIFEAFSQADSSTTKKFGGTGLGLTISNKLLQLMQSKLQIRSEEGIGSCFYFELEVNFQNYKQRLIKGFSQVLIVDGNEPSGMAIKKYCTLFGLEALLVTSVNDSFLVLEKNKDISLVLLNHKIMGKNSMAAMEQMMRIVRQSGQKVDFVALVGSHDKEETIESYEKIGCHWIIDKPVTPGKLESLLVKILDKGNKPKPSSVAAEMPAQKLQKHFKFLLAEDNAVNRMLVKIYFEKMYPGAQVLEAEDGKQALEVFLKEKPDLVITDIHMPEMNGYELLRAIRTSAFGKKVPIIGFTANAINREMPARPEYDFNAYLTKPVKQDKFRKVVGDLLSHKTVP